jgi:hypothetical protein
VALSARRGKIVLVPVALALGLGLIVCGLVLRVKRKEVMSRVTSRSLGSLAPGFANTPRGYGVYATLVELIGEAVVGIAVTPWTVLGWWLAAFAAILFVAFSVFAIVGEVITYRALKH